MSSPPHLSYTFSMMFKYRQLVYYSPSVLTASLPPSPSCTLLSNKGTGQDSSTTRQTPVGLRSPQNQQLRKRSI